MRPGPSAPVCESPIRNTALRDPSSPRSGRRQYETQSRSSDSPHSSSWIQSAVSSAIHGCALNGRYEARDPRILRVGRAVERSCIAAAALAFVVVRV
eukprot:5597114-Prymnesium_polylepis.1